MENPSSVDSPSAWLARQWGWTLARYNVMVEGDSDARFFELASRLYAREHGRKLICRNISIFAAGRGNDGGTYGVAERFPTLHNVMRLEQDENGKRRYRVIALLDDDPMGRRAVNGIQTGNRSVKEYENIFRLRRVMPRTAGSAKSLETKTKTANAEFSNLDCVVEDLVSATLCDEYATQFPHHRIGVPIQLGSGHHARWELVGKAGLLRHAEQRATLADVGRLIEVLISLRSYFGLPPEGGT
ncbi:hypothetical protein PQR52_09765 [Paraburkholderia aspalathi]|uniref:hypothetical protein n=1 Tax=Paraburkholderia aspalathi TaxID=1324617 RepID=UPI0038B73E72